MDSSIFLIVVVVSGAPAALAVWLIVRAISSRQRIDELSHRLRDLEIELIRLKRDQAARPPAEPKHATAPSPAPLPERVAAVPTARPAPIVATPPIPSATPEFVPPKPRPAPVPKPQPEPVFETPAPSEPVINWEQFLGVKGFAWLGGFALFLGVAFFIKYSFDNNLVPPWLRMTIGFLTGLGLLAGGGALSRKNFAALSQTLCATGVVILYSVTFACHSIYHFSLVGPLPAFSMMVLITGTAFLLAVRLDALVVAILGMLGGFLTPILLSTGQDNPFGLFGYIAVLDVGLMLVALNRRWHFLVACAALGTALMQLGWAGKFFESQHYFAGNKIFVALAVLLGFNAIWLLGNGWAKRRDQINGWFSGSGLGLIAVTFLLTAWFLDFEPLAHRPWLMFGFLFLIDLAAIALTQLDREIAPAQSLAGVAAFILLGCWTTKFLANDLLNAALLFYFVFAMLHSALPVMLQRRQGNVPLSWINQLFPILALVLVLMPVLQLTQVSFMVWPFILLVDLLAIALAVLTATVLPVLAVLLLTLAATGALIFKIPTDLTGLPTCIFLLGGYAVFFLVAGLWLVRKFAPGALAGEKKTDDAPAAPGDVAVILPACSIVLPFILLTMATLRLPLVDPAPVFGLALLLVMLLLGVAKVFSNDWLPVIGLICVTLLENAWHFSHFDASDPAQPLGSVLLWYLAFFVVFALYPFVFLRKFSGRVLPWAGAALAAVPQFFLVHRYVSAVYPNQFMGLLPAAFALPALASLFVIAKRVPKEIPARIGQMAWFGGVALFFITLIFPIQFDREWITLGWALEGAALLWLFHRVPHPGLRLAGVGLLLAAFARLALNPAVLEYHERAAVPIWNWYLYAYGIVTVCLFAGSRLLSPPRHFLGGLSVPPILAGFGTVLAFLLLNLEIADFFSAPGTTLTFDFADNFARDMSYSLGWALFALVVLVCGIAKRSPASRYGAMGLLGVTLLKLFVHDLAQLGELYRIGAFIGVAVIAMVASFAYQKFFSAVESASRDKAPGTQP